MTVIFIPRNGCSDSIIYLGVPSSQVNNKLPSFFFSVATSSVRLAIFPPWFPMGTFLFIYFIPTYVWFTLTYFILSEKNGRLITDILLVPDILVKNFMFIFQ